MQFTTSAMRRALVKSNYPADHLLALRLLLLSSSYKIFCLIRFDNIYLRSNNGGVCTSILANACADPEGGGGGAGGPGI